jgi:hypothetical protein
VDRRPACIVSVICPVLLPVSTATNEDLRGLTWIGDLVVSEPSLQLGVVPVVPCGGCVYTVSYAVFIYVGMLPTISLKESRLRVASEADEDGDEDEGVLVVGSPQLHGVLEVC